MKKKKTAGISVKSYVSIIVTRWRQYAPSKSQPVSLRGLAHKTSSKTSNQRGNMKKKQQISKRSVAASS